MHLQETPTNKSPSFISLEGRCGPSLGEIAEWKRQYTAERLEGAEAAGGCDLSPGSGDRGEGQTCRRPFPYYNNVLARLIMADWQILRKII